MIARFCTVGHSNRTPGEFVDILRAAEVGLVVDVRSSPALAAIPPSTSRCCRGIRQGARSAIATCWPLVAGPRP